VRGRREQRDAAGGASTADVTGADVTGADDDATPPGDAAPEVLATS